MRKSTNTEDSIMINTADLLAVTIGKLYKTVAIGIMIDRRR